MMGSRERGAVAQPGLNIPRRVMFSDELARNLISHRPTRTVTTMTFVYPTTLTDLAGKILVVVRYSTCIRDAGQGIETRSVM